MFARNLIKIANISRSQQVKLLNQPTTWKSLHTSSWLSQQTKDQQTENETIRVYYGTLTPNIRTVKVFSLTTSIGGLIAQPILYEQATKLGSSTPLIVAACGFVGFFTFVTPFLLHVITKRYVTELHYDPQTQEYIATVITFFLRRQQVRFKVEDVNVPEIPGMFTSFLVKPKGSGKKPMALFVDPRLFEDPTHYVKLMGYDKPIDFKLDFAEKPSEKK